MLIQKRNLTVLREFYRFTQDDLARWIGCSQAQVSLAESVNGQRVDSLVRDNLLIVAEKLKFEGNPETLLEMYDGGLDQFVIKNQEAS